MSRRARYAVRLTTATVVAFLLTGCERPPVDSVQSGYRGTGMQQVYNPRLMAEQIPANQPPPLIPAAADGGPLASTTYKNVQVLGNLTVNEFTRTMVAITNWVAPKEGCTYCHAAGEDLSSDKLYTKVVARKMLLMTQKLNSDWKSHVGNTGVTCYTCHRGEHIPKEVWFNDPRTDKIRGLLGNLANQNLPERSVAYSSLPSDPYSPFLLKDNDIRVIGATALPTGNRKSIKQGEWTYGLMMHMSQSLGVNCTFCHNSRAFSEWDESTPQRVTAWHGIRMVRDINVAHMEPLTGTFPASRLGDMGDVAKTNCATCHQGAYKPLYGAPMATSYPALSKALTQLGGGTPVPPPEVRADGATVFFAVGSSALDSSAAKLLEPVVKAIMTKAAGKALVSGFHSATGDLATNQELAKQRAFAVRDALRAAGLPEDRVVLDKPLQAEANLSGEDPKARKVDIRLQ